MAILNAQTLEQLRVSVGRNFRAVYTSTMTSAGSTSTFIDSTLENADDYINGRWFRATSGTNDGAERIVDDYTGSTTTGTTRGDVLAASTADGDTYELWDHDLRPTDVDDYINQAIRAVTRAGAPPVRDISLHTSTYQRVLPIPSNVVGIHSVEYRSWFTYLDVERCESAWSELVDDDVTASADTEDKREGSASAKFVCAAALGAGDIIATNTVSLDLSGYTHIEGWIKTTVATSAAGDLQLLLDNTAQCASPLETLNIPALSADTWTRFRLALANPESDTAIISVGLQHTTDIGAATIWLDDIKAVRDNDEDWEPLNWKHWSIDRDAREIILRPEAYYTAPYNMLLLRGYKKPTVLSADSDSCDIEPAYIIAKACALILNATGDRYAANRQAAWTESEKWEALAARELGRSRKPEATRWVDD